VKLPWQPELPSDSSLQRRSWGPEGPPEEAYKTSTNPERFAPILDFCGELIDNLQRHFEITRTEAEDLDEDLTRTSVTRPLIRLVPSIEEAAPLTFAFTPGPGVGVKLGKWWIEYFPTCLCDACDDTARGAAQRLVEQIHSVAAGHFREGIHPLADGDFWQEAEFRPPDRRWATAGRISWPGWRLTPEEAAARLAGNRSEYDWQPWPLR